MLVKNNDVKCPVYVGGGDSCGYSSIISPSIVTLSINPLSFSINSNL